jgi:hypothetical protein
MSLKHVDLASAMRRLADKRIDDAIQEGKFANLPGAGKPIDLEPMPAEEGARMMWWTLRILKNNNVIPEEVAWRKSIDHLKSRLPHARDEEHLVQIVTQLNHLVHKLNTLGTNAMNAGAGLAPLDLEHERESFRQRRQK